MQVVRIDKKGRALDHAVTLKKSENDSVIWIALGNGGPWKITFDKQNVVPPGSPFGDDDFTVPQGSYVPSGPLDGNPNGTYKYNVRDPKKPLPNNITDDPDVDVE